MISASALNPLPSPNATERPRCQPNARSCTIRRSSSQLRRDLPSPASPITPTMWRAAGPSLTRRATPATASNCASRPTRGGSIVPDRTAPASSRMPSARHTRTGTVRPLTVCRPASSNSTARSHATRVTSSTSTVSGSAIDWMRAAVLTASPVTIPSSALPTSTAASPVSTPTRTRSSGSDNAPARTATAWTISRPALTARSASSSRAIGAPHNAITASPMNFSISPP